MNSWKKEPGVPQLSGRDPSSELLVSVSCLSAGKVAGLAPQFTLSPPCSSVFLTVSEVRAVRSPRAGDRVPSGVGAS